MDKQRVFFPDLKGYLPYRFYERLGLYVSDSTAYLCYNDISVRLFADRINELLYFVGYVRYHLNSRSKILSSSFLVEYIPVNLTCREVRILVKILVDETLVMTEIKVCFCTVFGNVDLAVLIWAHRAGVNIDIWVELLCCNGQSS